LRKQQRWEEARAVLGQARVRLGDVGSEDLRIRLEQEEKLLKLVRQLDDLRMKRATVLDRVSDSGTDRAALDREYAELFRTAGVAGEAEAPALVAERVRKSPIAEPLLAALDSWASATRDESRLSWIFAVARLADPDSDRGLLRDLKAWNDFALLE